jgi:hypothetical protein
MGAPESDSPYQITPPEEVRTPPEAPGNAAAAPLESERQNVLMSQARGEQATELLQPAGILRLLVTTGGMDGNSAQQMYELKACLEHCQTIKWRFPNNFIYARSAGPIVYRLQGLGWAVRGDFVVG